MAVNTKSSLMTIDEIAKYLRMKKVTIYKHAQEGKVPGFKVGSKWRFKKSTVDKWIAHKENSNRK
ncbi:MAG: helix-turn-helix domain-containing protein [Candidatus Omnitrophota bacterium]|nr:MAG: helix-turn-helix domain-containing protein [Candidatus Omnitrophota bacterium]